MTNYKSSLGGSITKLGETILSTAGTSLKVDGLSIDLHPNTGKTYSAVLIFFSLLGATTTVLTAKINGGTEYYGTTSKLVSGTRTEASFSNTAPLAFSQALTSTQWGGGNATITMGRDSSAVTLRINWQLTGDETAVIEGHAGLKEVRSTTFTSFEIIGSANLGQYSQMTVYGIKK